MILWGMPVFAAVIAQAPGNFVFDGAIREWKGTPPFSREDPARSSIWLAQSPRGLVVAGFIRDPHFKFAHTAGELATGGRLELRISLVDSIAMPALTYDEQACTNGLNGNEEKKVNCLRWVRKQANFRQQIEKLFTRKWRIAPYFAEETCAVAAYDGLTEAQRNALGFSRPSEQPVYKFQTGPDGAISFEILVAWHLFPPADRLSLEQVRVRLDIADRNLAIVTSDPDVHSTEADRPPVIAVAPPITTRITPCGQPLLGPTLDEQDVPAYYFLNDSLEVYDVFVLENPLRPYMPDFPKESDLSPVASYRHFFTQDLDPGEQLCGPFMSYRKGNLVRQFSIRLEPDNSIAAGATGPPFPVKRLANGTRLIQLGPSTSSGALWRRAWAYYSLKIFALTPSLEVQEALNIGACLGGCPAEVDDYETVVSSDWRTVTAFQEKDDQWSSETFCLTGEIYLSCGKGSDSPPRAKKKP